MPKFKMVGTIFVLLVVVGMLLAACGSANTSQPTSATQKVVEAAASPTAMTLPTDTLVPAVPTDTPLPEPSPVPTLSPTTQLATEPPPIPTAVPTEGPLPTPESDLGTTPELRSVEEVSLDGPPQIVDITDENAVLLFESSIPLACSVIYGETTAYGQISVDQDMGGGAHTDHHPLLLGLKPDTVYHYRVQGTAADGTLYVGEDMTFRTLLAEEQTEVNLASPEAGARVVAVSSNFGGAANDQAWGAGSAIDGQRGTAWSSNGDGNDAFIEVELAQPSQVYAVEVWTRSMSDGTAQIFAFTLTTDGGEILGPFTLKDDGQAYRFDVDVVARSLRLDVVDSSGGNTGLIEFAVYGTPAGN